MQPWFIPMFYVCGAVLGGLALPRIEQAYLSSYSIALSVASAQALLSAAASGMMALTGIVFAMAFVMVQFSAIAYSPRLVLWFARDRMLFHALGAFTATFVYALFALAWVDRGGSAKVPMFSLLLVGIMIIISMFMFARLMQRLGDLQIGNVLHLVGDRGRAVIGEMFRRLDEASAARRPPESAAGKPRTRSRNPNREVSWQAPHNRQARCRFSRRPSAKRGRNHRDDVRGRRYADRGCGSSPCSWLGRAATGGRAQTRRSSRARTNFRAGPEISNPPSRGHRHQGAVAGDQRPDDGGPDFDQLEDLLRRLGAAELDAGDVVDETGALRLIVPTPTWEDYLTLSFDEIRHFGSSSVQVMRRMRSALVGLAASLPSPERVEAVRRYVEHLDRDIEASPFDADDKRMARQEDRQGIGLSRRNVDTS